MLFRTEVVGLAQDGDGVTVRLRDRDSGARGRSPRAYAVGADGPRSRVRDPPASGRTSSAGSATSRDHFRADSTGRLPGRRYGIYATDEGVFVPAGRDRWLHGRRARPGGDGGRLTAERCLAALRSGTGVPDLAPRIDAAAVPDGGRARPGRTGPAGSSWSATPRTR